MGFFWSIVFTLWIRSSMQHYIADFTPASEICEVTGNATAQTSTGKLTGVQCFIQTSENSEEYGRSIPLNIFQAIPYARPPTRAHERFRPPRPLSWSGTYDSRHSAKACIQPVDRRVSAHGTDGHYWEISDDEMSEDCLYLSITAPRNCENCAAIIWLPGNDFTTGSITMPIYDGTVLAATQKIIYISVNYRLGAFGFLYGANKMAPGNVGLFDQQLALKWIHTNIHVFGGSPDKITLAGDNSGSACVGFHLNNPHSRHYFSRAIMYGGNHMTPGAFEPPKQALDQTKELAIKCKCFGYSHQEMIGCLARVDAMTLRDRAEELYCNPLSCTTFAPTYDHNMFVRMPTIAQRRSQLWPSLPVMTAVNLNQVTSSILNFVPRHFDDFGNLFPEYRVSMDSLNNLSEAQFDFLMREMTDYIRNANLPLVDMAAMCLVLNATSMLETANDSFESFDSIFPALIGSEMWRKGLHTNYSRALITCLSDIYVNCPTQMFLNGLSETVKSESLHSEDVHDNTESKTSGPSKGNVGSLYVLNVRPKGTYWPEWAGVNQGDELLYILGHLCELKSNRSKKRYHDEVWSQLIMVAIGDFVKGNDEDGLFNFPELPYSKAKKPYLVLDNENTRIEHRFRDNECKLWKSVLKPAHENAQMFGSEF